MTAAIQKAVVQQIQEDQIKLAMLALNDVQKNPIALCSQSVDTRDGISGIRTS